MNLVRGLKKEFPNLSHEAMVVMQPLLAIKSPCFFTSMITNFYDIHGFNSTYEQLLEFTIQGIQTRTENNPSELAIVNLDKNATYFHILNTHTHPLKIVPKFNKNIDDKSTNM